MLKSMSRLAWMSHVFNEVLPYRRDLLAPTVCYLLTLPCAHMTLPGALLGDLELSQPSQYSQDDGFLLNKRQKASVITLSTARARTAIAFI